MKDILILYCLFYLCSYIYGSSDDTSEEIEIEEEEINEYTAEAVSEYEPYTNEDLLPDDLQSDCWMTLNAEKHYKILDEIDSRYSEIRKQVQEALIENEFDKSMIEGLMRERGVALRELASYQHKKWMIPSGINLGGFSLLRMPESILFFHRMKLRNNTYFRLDSLHNELDKMVVRINLSLNDLHLKGAYERSLTDTDPSVLIYAPTFGEVEFLLKDVKYKLEGRYRLIENRLLIELVTSDLIIDEVLMTYVNQVVESAAIKISKENLGAFEARLKTDLDKWIKDYFNDYMIYAQMDGIPHIKELAKYDKEKGIALEEFTDYAISAIATRIRNLHANSIGLPSFTFKSIQGLQIKLYDGVLNGLDSIFRRSVATGYKEGDIRKVDSTVGFSSLKVLYKYEAIIPTGVPPLAGGLTLSADELTAHMALAMVAEPETVDLDLQFLEQMNPESLTVEGSANIMISNFKHLLEHQIVATMYNAMINSVIMLKSLPRCEPFIPGQTEKKEPQSLETGGDVTVELPSSDGGASGDEWLTTNLRKHPKSPMKQSNRSKIRKIARDQKIYKKKNHSELKKYKLKNKKKQEINKI